jgi:hypothetical protein
MKYLVIGIVAAITVAATDQVRAQVAPPATQLAQWAAPGYPGYPLNAPTPEDAYRQGLINRWELERLTGPLPPALQGPSVNGERGDSDGGGRH